jgi:hypothetical protein
MMVRGGMLFFRIKKKGLSLKLSLQGKNNNEKQWGRRFKV